MSVGTLDIAILLVYLAAVVALGARVGRGARSAEDYMLGGRDLPWWLILVSIVATESVGLYCFCQLFPPEATFERADRIFAHFIVHQMPTGLLGLLLGAVFAAAIENPGLKSWATLCRPTGWNDALCAAPSP